MSLAIRCPFDLNTAPVTALLCSTLEANPNPNRRVARSFSFWPSSIQMQIVAHLSPTYDASPLLPESKSKASRSSLLRLRAASFLRRPCSRSSTSMPRSGRGAAPSDACTSCRKGAAGEGLNFVQSVDPRCSADREHHCQVHCQHVRRPRAKEDDARDASRARRPLYP
ncbi:hypothetical protein DFH09DRAFT_1203874 [Mycena vulgaris]|nr:hypothetical protein DFH09DRAFT_1203874 [Mycena vulgaris]